MTLDQCYQANAGRSLLIPGGGAGNEGQCLQWVETVTHDVYNIPYIYTPGAIDFWNKFDALGLDKWFTKVIDGSIKKGDVVVFNTSVGSQYGHIDVAMEDGTTDSFEGADSNWGGVKTVHLVKHVDKQYVLGVLRPKGVDMPTAGNVNTVIFLGLRRKATQPEIDKFSKLEWGKLFDYVQTVQTAHDIIPRPSLGLAAVREYLSSHLT